MDDDDVTKEKDVQYYSQLIGAWINSSFEKDKSVLNLAAASLGAELTYYLTGNKNTSAFSLALFALSSAALMISIVGVLKSFSLNKKHIEALANNEHANSIGWIDGVISYSFIAGIAIAVLNFSIIIFSSNTSTSKENEYSALIKMESPASTQKADKAKIKQQQMPNSSEEIGKINSNIGNVEIFFTQNKGDSK